MGRYQAKSESSAGSYTGRERHDAVCKDRMPRNMWNIVQGDRCYCADDDQIPIVINEHKLDSGFKDHVV